MVRGNSVSSPDYPRVLFPTRTSTYFLPASASRPSATYLWQVMLPYSTQQILSTVEMCPVAYSWHVLWLLISINHKIRFSACGFCVIRSFSSQRAVTLKQILCFLDYVPMGLPEPCKNGRSDSSGPYVLPVVVHLRSQATASLLVHSTTPEAARTGQVGRIEAPGVLPFSVLLWRV